LIEIIGDTSAELAAAAATSVIPIPAVGGILATKLDIMIALMMTWRVGAMISAFYQNDGKWVGGTRKATYQAGKSITGGLSYKNKNRVNLDELSIKLNEVFETQVAATMRYIKQHILKLRPDMTPEEVLTHLLEIDPPYPEKIAREAVKREMGA
jgi:hypothetical protein